MAMCAYLHAVRCVLCMWECIWSIGQSACALIAEGRNNTNQTCTFYWKIVYILHFFSLWPSFSLARSFMLYLSLSLFLVLLLSLFSPLSFLLIIIHLVPLPPFLSHPLPFSFPLFSDAPQTMQILCARSSYTMHIMQNGFRVQRNLSR